MKRTLYLLVLVMLACSPIMLAQGGGGPTPGPEPVAGLGVFAAAALLATFVEGTTEYIFGRYEKIAPYIIYIALALGIAISVAYKVDIIAGLGVASPIPFIGYVVTGLIIGRGSNFLNDLITRVRNPVGTTKATTNTLGASSISAVKG